MSDPSEPAEALGKIVDGSEGLGTVTPEMVETRAVEIARTDGRTQANDGDRAQAKHELQGLDTEVTGPETVDPELENVTEWNDSPADHGTKVPEVLPEDEANIAEVLIQEGMEEADHNQRVSAADEFLSEEEEEERS